MQSAVANWVLDVARRRPLFVVIDDAHALDASSAGGLTLLAHSAQSTRLMLVTTQLLGAESPSALQQLARSAARIKLRGLEPHALEALVASVFGDAPDRARLVLWLASVTQGNPGHTLALLRHLLDQKIIRYDGGAWLLPTDFTGSNLPRGIADALSARLHQLDPPALLLARMFATHRGVLPLSVCFKLLPRCRLGSSQTPCSAW